MDVVSGNTLLPGDPRLIEHLVCELKSQGIFDQFRKECIADVDTKPAYQNLRQRVEGSVTGFLKTQAWRPDMNKNHLREMLRKNIYESGFLETGVERIVDQVVNPKINTVFLPQVEDVVYKFLGLEKPTRNATYKPTNGPLSINTADLLPTDLDPISPDSEVLDKTLNKSNETEKLDDSKLDDFESPPFEPITEQSVFSAHEESSNDSHVSGISGLTSHDSNTSDNSPNKLNVSAPDISNQDSQLSKVSSNSRLSIITNESKHNSEKMDISDDTQESKISRNGDESNSKNLFNFDGKINAENGVMSFQMKQEIHDELEAIRKEINEGKAQEKENDLKDDNTEVKMEIDEKSNSSVIMTDVPEMHMTNEEPQTTKTVENNKNDSIDSEEIKIEENKIDETKIEDDKTEELICNDLSKLETTKSETTLTETKPSETTITEMKTIETKTTETKTIETKTTETKTNETKTIEIKSSETKSSEKSERNRTDSEKRRSSSSKYSESKDRKDDKDKKSDSKESRDRKDKDKYRSSSSSSSKDKDKYRDKSKDSSKSKEKEKDTKSKDDSKVKDDKDSKSKSSSSKHSSRDRSSSKSESKSDSKTESKSSSRDRSKSSKDSKPKDDKTKSEESKPKKDSDDSKSKTESKTKSSSRSRDHSRSESSKHSSRDRKSSSSRDHRDKKDPKRSTKRDKDDHSSSRDKKSESRRSADRDSNDGSSGTGNHNSNSSKDKETSSSSNKSKSSDNSDSYQGSNSGDSGQSDNSQNSLQAVEDTTKSSIKVVTSDLSAEVVISPLKLDSNSDSDTTIKKIKKPKFASNIFEARRLIKVRKKLEKMEKKRQRQRELVLAVGVRDLDSPNMEVDSVDDTDSVDSETLVVNQISEEEKGKKEDDNSEKNEISQILELGEEAKKQNTNYVKIITNQPQIKLHRVSVTQTDSDVKSSDVTTPSSNSAVVSKASWDAIEAKLSQSVNVDYDSYQDENADTSSSNVNDADQTTNKRSLRLSAEDEDCLYFNSEVSPTTERFLKSIETFQKDNGSLVPKTEAPTNQTTEMAPPNPTLDRAVKRSRKANLKNNLHVDYDEITYPNKKAATTEVKPSAKKKGKGKKRKLDGEDSENNNKRIQHTFDVVELAEEFDDVVMEPSPSASNASNGSTDHTAKIRPPAKGKKTKKNNSVNNSESFPLPLSPDSDVSACSVEVKQADKEPTAPVKQARASILKTQRYSSDDLYKPRPFVSGTSRRQRGLLNSTDKNSDETPGKLRR